MSVQNNYQRLLEQIAAEAQAAGRNPSDIQLIAVSKNHPWTVVKELYDAGCHVFGENRVQEALPKIQEAPKDIQWHLIGTLQRKKVPKIIGLFSLIHSVDSFDLAEKISEVSKERATNILLQVNVTGEESKQGFTPNNVLSEFKRLQSLPHLNIQGLMTMAPLEASSEECFECFSKLRELRDELSLKELSMGMSNDWKEAVRAGATMLRIGSALFQESPITSK